MNRPFSCSRFKIEVNEFAFYIVLNYFYNSNVLFWFLIIAVITLNSLIIIPIIKQMFSDIFLAHLSETQGELIVYYFVCRPSVHPQLLKRLLL